MAEPFGRLLAIDAVPDLIKAERHNDKAPFTQSVPTRHDEGLEER